jgi:hypothetical protein
MKWIYLTGVAAAAFCATAASAADMAGMKKAPEAPPPAKPFVAWPEPNFDVLGSGFDYAWGAKFGSDYISRGISQTARGPSATVYGEARYGWFYAGIQPWNVRLPTSPLMELDIYGGIRPTWGPLTLDFGVIYYAYPGNHQQWWLGGSVPVATFNSGPFGAAVAPTTAFDPSYVEIYAKPSWAINDWFTLGSVFAYDPNWNNYGAHALYTEGNLKITPLPNTDYSGFSISGAFGHYYLGMANTSYGASYVDPDYVSFATGGGSWGAKGFKFASYNTWNVGMSYNWNMVTLDLRYHDSTQSKGACFINTSDPSGNYGAVINAATTNRSSSSWCGSRFMASVSVDFTSATFK